MRKLICLLAILFVTGCVGTVVGTATDLVIETVKIPFKVGKAIVDVASDDDSSDTDSHDKSDDSSS